MCKKILSSNSALYLLALLNLFYAVKNGFSWLSIVTFVLTGIVLVWDIVKAVKRDD